MGFTDNATKPPALILKVNGRDFVSSSARAEDQSLVPFEIPYAFVKAQGKSYAGKEYVNFRCETGGACVGYEMLKTPELQMAFADAFSVVISRNDGSTDIAIPVSVLRDFPKEAMAYSDCSVKLLTALQQKFRR